ncbi:MAG: hypothetical protein JRE23_10045 [Deltaproteobacteria bacterium]|nr:hypothetical protein [Deltaproteobacteria bacterium]
MNIRGFAEVLADRQGGIYIKPGQAHSHVLTKKKVLEIFGEIPTYSIQYNYVISVSGLEDDMYQVVVKREK